MVWLEKQFVCNTRAIHFHNFVPSLSDNDDTVNDDCRFKSRWWHLCRVLAPMPSVEYSTFEYSRDGGVVLLHIRSGLETSPSWISFRHDRLIKIYWPSVERYLVALLFTIIWSAIPCSTFCRVPFCSIAARDALFYPKTSMYSLLNK